MPNFLLEYATEFEKLGLARFAMRHTAAMLVGVGMVGDLEEESRSHGRSNTITSHMSEIESVTETTSLAGRVWPIEREAGRGPAAIRVGRSAENDIVIPEYSLSRTHCAFKYVSGGIAIVDLESTNGTQVKGEILTPNRLFKLEDGDEIVLGRYRFEFLGNKAFLKLIQEMVETRRFLPRELWD
ncbi:MAG: FHA domain-containing protein [Pseudomonadota bacterium]